MPSRVKSAKKSQPNGGEEKKTTNPARNTATWDVTCSAMASSIVNPIRAISDKASTLSSGSGKPLIKLSIGDPTVDKNFYGAPQAHIDAVKAALDSHDYDGYAPSNGAPEARQAVVDFWTKNFITAPPEGSDEAAHEEYRRKIASVQKEHVVLTSGGSHAIQLAVTSICGKGDNVLIPSPGFPHYVTICDTFGIRKKFYKLDPNKHWEVNLQELEKKCDANTKLLIITNPSNPCGSNWSRSHVEDIVKLAEKLKLPILADEIYGGMVFQNERRGGAKGKKQRHVFTSVLDFNTTVPRVVLGGTAKILVVPGWRIGWLIYAGDSSVPAAAETQEPAEAATVENGQKYPSTTGENFFYGIEQQALLIVGPSTLAQGALPLFLPTFSTSMAPRPAKSAEEMEQETQAEKDDAYFYRYVSKIEHSARAFVDELTKQCLIPDPEMQKGRTRHMVHANMPQGSMYIMIKVNTQFFDKNVVHDDVSFFENLLKEQQVQLVPGTAFRRPGFLRVVITRPESVVREAAQRIGEFCRAHYDPEASAQYLSEKASKKKTKEKKGEKTKKARKPSDNDNAPADPTAGEAHEEPKAEQATAVPYEEPDCEEAALAGNADPDADAAGAKEVGSSADVPPADTAADEGEKATEEPHE